MSFCTGRDNNILSVRRTRTLGAASGVGARCWIAIAAVVLLLTPSAPAAVLYSDSRVSASGTGLSWAQAKKTIGEALTAAAAGDEIWVASGTYVQTITLKQGVALYGGFSGGETERNARNCAANPTSIVAGSGQLRAVQVASIGNIRLDGFLVSEGSSAALNVQGLTGSFVVANCTFRGSAGDGIRCSSSSPAIQDCLVYGNGGNGIYCSYSSPAIERCAIAGNAASGIYCQYASPSVADCTIIGNSCEGLLLNLGACLCPVENCLVAGNTGAGISVCGSSAPVVVNCTFVSNTAAGTALGGAIKTNNTGHFTLRNSILLDNSSMAVFENAYGNNEVSNCLFFANPGGDYFDRECYLLFTGAAAINASVVGASGALDGNPLFADVASGTWTAAPEYNATTRLTTLTNASASFEPGTLAGLVINCDTGQRRHALIISNTETTIEAAVFSPLSYIQAGDSYTVRDFRLREDSPCVDAGIATGAPEADLEGFPRPMDAPDRGVDGTGTEFDLGAYEYQPNFGSKSLTIAGVDGGGTVTPANGGIYDFGQSVSLLATPKRGCAFDHWFMRQHVDPPVVPIEHSTSESDYALSMTQDWDVWAYFTGTPQYLLNLTTLGPGAVSVTPQNGPYAEGTSVALQATPDAAARFQGWQGDIEGTANPANLTMNEDKSVTASFVQTYQLVTQVQGSGSVQPAGGTFDAGSPVTLTAIPDERWCFNHWEGAASGTDNPTTLQMDSDCTVVAVFAAPPTAGFTATPTNGLLPLAVQFTDTSTPGGCPIVSWSWDFNNDGITDSTEQNPSHIYTLSGTYAVTLTVTSAVGPDTLTKTGFVRVQELPNPDFTSTQATGQAPLTVQFTDTSTCGSDPITAWAWDFDNNGTTDSTLQNPTFVYSTPAVYSVKLVVTTAAGSNHELKTHYTRAGVAPVPQPENTFGELYADLIPPDSQIASYDAERFAVVIGVTRDINGTPIPGVAVTVLGAPEFGTAYTDATGRFSLPLEGGGNITVVYQKPGFVASQRSLDVPTKDVTIVDPVTMLEADAAATTVALDGNPDSLYVHRSTPVSDTDGSRACTLVLTGDTGVNEVDAAGNVLRPLTRFTVRATEFRTQESMPAQLPAASAYTYCVELSVDGAPRVAFGKPVIMWTENFLGFSVGQFVPVGSYDRDLGVWKPEKDGVVVKLLDTDNNGTVDALDATGDNAADDLDGDSQTADEVAGLGNTQLYVPGAVFWRTQVTHFSPWDCNWPYGPPGDAVPPTPTGGPRSAGDNGGTGGGGANGGTGGFGTVTHKGRVFHEDIPIAGTGLTLHYASDRADGFKTVVTVPVSGDRALPASLTEIRAVVEIGGRQFKQSFTPAPNLTAQFEWDGLDWQGRVMPQARANSRVEFIYDCVLWSSGELSPGQTQLLRSFGAPGVSQTMIPARMEFVATRTFPPIQVVSAKRSDTLAAGWTVSNHHRLDTRGLPLLQRGDGVMATNPAWIMDTVYGGVLDPTVLAGVQGLCTSADGTLYAADTSRHRIIRLDRAGGEDLVVGSTGGYAGDGGSIKFAKLNAPRDVAVDAFERIFIADTNNDRIRMVDRNGIITTVAGGAGNGFAGDNGPAVNARLNRPQGVTVDADGNIYIADTSNHRVRKVDPAGIITTYAGNGETGNSGDGGRAVVARIQAPRDLATDDHGNLYIASAFGANRIRKVNPTGIITTVAGTGMMGTGGEGDGGLATQAELQGGYAIAVDGPGNIYISEDNRVRRVDTGGIITTFAGTGQAGYSGDGDAAKLACLNTQAFGLALGPDGSLYIADSGNRAIRKVGSGLDIHQEMIPLETPIGTDEYPFAEASGILHVMSKAGRHLRTVDQSSGKTLLTYQYDTSDALVSMTDSLGETLTIQRNAQGVPTAVVSPDGTVTTLTVDALNHLTAVSYPDGAGYAMTYEAGGLLQTINANGRAYANSYDDFGRIDSILDPLSSEWSFSSALAVSGNELYAALTPQQDSVSYDNSIDSSGAVQTNITTGSGQTTLYKQDPAETFETLTLPTGTRVTSGYSIDPVFNYKRLSSASVEMPSGLQATAQWSTEYRDNPDDEVDPDILFDKIVYTRTIQSGETPRHIWTLTDDLKAGTLTSGSPEGRTATTSYDLNTQLVISTQVPGLFDQTYQYDARGRLTHTAVSAREMVYAYDNAGNLSSVTEPVTGTVSFDYDPVGRITQITQPDQATTVGFEYDLDGNLESITLPTQAVHTFAYDALNQNTSYTTPLNRTYQYAYDSSRRLTGVTLPSGAALQYNYTQDRLTGVVTPDGTTGLAYDTAGRVQSFTRGTESVTLAYDGDLVTAQTLAGTLNLALSMAYYADFSLASLTYAGATQGYAYDADGLLTGAGAFTVTRDPQNGLATAVTDGIVTVSRAINGYAEATGIATTVNGTTAAWSTTLDNAGRITAKTETLGAVTTTYAYTYDALGHLSTVTRNGISDEAYTVDANGRRTLETNASRGLVNRAFTYDAEDRLLTAGNAACTYDEDGFLATKTVGQDITAYAYTRNGALKSVTLPDGTLIEYVLDPGEQRIAKKVNGVLTEKYLWAGLTGLLAVYDASDNLIARFDYADGPLPLKTVQNGATYYLAYDQVGSLRAVLNANGAVVHQIAYDTFGNILTETNSGLCLPFGFAGGLHDRATALVRFGHRDYDPDTARWTAKDPIGFGAGDTNVYGYCFNDPVNFNDPPGLGAYEDILYHSGNFFSGMGDILSFNLTAKARQLTGADRVVNTSSRLYVVGELAGFANSLILGGALGSANSARSGVSLGMTRANAAFPRGIEAVERSHWIPNRYRLIPDFIRDSSYNIKPMWGSDHALADPLRYRFMRKWWKSQHQLPPTVVQQWNRMPGWAQGASIGAAYASTSAGKVNLQ